MKLSELMKLKENITVGYLGGSITEADKYRNVVNSYLKKTYPNNTINEINAGVGGTTSFLGVYRCERDLFSKKPDIIFVEFSVNDSSNDETDFTIFERTMEGIVRKALKKNILIVILGLTTKALNDKCYENGLTPKSVLAHKKVADYYNIPFINAGETLYNHTKENGEDIKEYLPDNVHPNEKGGEFYGNEIIKLLNHYNWNMNFKVNPICENNLENATLLMAENYANKSFKVSKCSLYGQLPNYIYSCVPNSAVEVPFYGSAIGIYCTTEKDSGILEYKVDDGEWVKISTWDKYAIDFNRAHNYLFTADLEKKNHTLTLKVSHEKDVDSEGHYIRIGAFLAEDSNEQSN